LPGRNKGSAEDTFTGRGYKILAIQKISQLNSLPSRQFVYMPEKIIIIEDDLDILDIMTYILSEEGYDILAAVNSKPLEEVHLHQPMLIIMDNRLTDGFGFDFCKQFKSNPATLHFPVVLVSANSNLEEMAAQSLADGYLKKPFDIVELIELVKRFD
jgi:two-component system, OmpR family, phosphate regulon response regulator PhoB